MGGVLIYLAGAACVITLAVLAVGIGGFGSGKISPKGQNKIMRMRIIAQFVAVILIMLTVWAMKGS